MDFRLIIVLVLSIFLMVACIIDIRKSRKERRVFKEEEKKREEEYSLTIAELNRTDKMFLPSRHEFLKKKANFLKNKNKYWWHP